MNEGEGKGVYMLNEVMSASSLVCSLIAETSYQLNSSYILPCLLQCIYLYVCVYVTN
jgi:hypothetical protein